MFQKTITQKLEFHGISVHSGLKSSVTLRPLGPNSGIILKEAGTVGTFVPQITQFATVIKSGNFSISTIEHIMAAVVGMGIDNLEIEFDGSEAPILDGSSKPFVDEISRAGLKEQGEHKTFLTPKKILEFSDVTKDRYIKIIPAEHGDVSLSIDYFASFGHPLLGEARIVSKISPEFFAKEIAPARTFGFLSDLPKMKALGLANGSSLENTVVIGESGFLNEPRFSDEFVRHKLLDLIGDLALLGKPIAGTIVARKTGHEFNRLVVEHFVNHSEEWEIIRSPV